MCKSLCTKLVHNIACNNSDSVSCYCQDNQHCWRLGLLKTTVSLAHWILQKRSVFTLYFFRTAYLFCRPCCRRRPTVTVCPTRTWQKPRSDWSQCRWPQTVPSFPAVVPGQRWLLPDDRCADLRPTQLQTACSWSSQADGLADDRCACYDYDSSDTSA